MTNQSDIKGNQNIVIQGVSESTIILNDNGEILEIKKQLTELKTLLEQKNIQTFQTADKIYNIGSITNANFDFVVAQSSHNRTLPPDLAENLITDKNRWVQSLRGELLRYGISVGNRPLDIIQHYGWLIEEFLRKMLTAEGQERTLRALSFMTEAWQSSVRYLCYVQVAQLLKMDKKAQNPVLTDFINMRTAATIDTNFLSTEISFDYLNFLLISTDLLTNEKSFMPEIAVFVEELSNIQNELYATALFLEKHRQRLLSNTIIEDDQLPQLLDEYLTGLVFWLRKLAFLAKYRLVSIKDISLNYRLGTPKNFVHLYGELHGMYNEAFASDEDYNAKAIEGIFTYNQSILLLKGSDVATCLDNITDSDTYLSISPLVIDQSVFAEKPTQTPEVFTTPAAEQEDGNTSTHNTKTNWLLESSIPCPLIKP